MWSSKSALSLPWHTARPCSSATPAVSCASGPEISQWNLDASDVRPGAEKPSTGKRLPFLPSELRFCPVDVNTQSDLGSHTLKMAESPSAWVLKWLHGAHAHTHTHTHPNYHIIIPTTNYRKEFCIKPLIFPGSSVTTASIYWPYLQTVACLITKRGAIVMGRTVKFSSG